MNTALHLSPFTTDLESDHPVHLEAMDIMRECTANYLFRYSFKYEEFILAESGGIDRQRPSEDRIVEKIQQLKDGSRGGGWDVLAVLSDILGIKFIIVSNQQEDILIYESTAGISTQEVYLYFNGPDSYYSIVGVSDWNRDTDPRRSDATTTRTAAENSNESLGPKATANQLPYCSAVPLTISENSAAGRVDIPNTADTNKSSQGSLDRLDVGKELSCNEVHNDKEIINSEAYYQVFTSNYDHLKILRIPPDGNCLFGSIVHQLENLDIRSSGHKKSVADLRRRCVNFLEQHWTRYENSIISEAVNRQEQWPADEFKEAFIEKQIEALRKDRTWGGSEILAAASDMLEKKIKVFTKRLPPITFGEVGGYPGRTLRIFLNGTNHYDSVVSASVAEDSSRLSSKAGEMSATCRDRRMEAVTDGLKQQRPGSRPPIGSTTVVDSAR